jgi:N-acyl-D-aspartate/D-glutamate deacylase
MACLLVSAPPATSEPPATSLIILRGGTLHDGSGGPGKKGDLAIRGDRIIAIGMVKEEPGSVVIDARGLIVAPGFIDLHTHCDTALLEPATRSNLNYLLQGVTTVVTGNCGAGPVNVADYFKKLTENPPGTNVVHLLPHNDIRRQVLGNFNRPPVADELKKMEALIEQGMKDGAWGMSTGLIYNPGTYAKTDEIIALAKVVAKHGGFYASHIRNEGVNVLVSVDEAITIGREAKLPVHVSHMKVSLQRAWDKQADEISMIQSVRKRGQVVTADQYPYIASSTSLMATVVPPRYREGTGKDFLARLDDAELGPKIRKGIEQNLKERRDGQAIRIAYYEANPAWHGKSIADIAREEKKEPVDIVIEIQRKGGASIIHFGISEDNVRLVMKQDFVATASDGRSMVPGPTMPHPRSYGTFPRKIGHYALSEGVITLEQALRSASGLPADILRLKERGYLRKGFVADIVVFDPATFRDRATFEKPHQYATGVRHVFVIGAHVIREGKFTDTFAGKPLVRQEHIR